MSKVEPGSRAGPLDGMVRVQALRLYSEVVEELGGNPARLLELARIAPQSLSQVDAFISYRSLIHLLERRSEEHTSELQSLMRTSYAVFCLQNKQMTQQKIM